jgi:hypothetical protein
MKCPRCGKDNPADVHTCNAPLAIYLAEQCESDVQSPDCDCERCELFRAAAAELRRLHAEKEALREALKQCRKMVGHPDNIALIDAALTGGKT